MMSVSGPGDDLMRDYALARSRVAAHERTTLLRIGEHDTTVISGLGDAPDHVLTLALGSTRTAATFLRHDLPTPGELESAIDTVEDEVLRARTVPSHHAVLVTTDATLHQFADIAGQPAAGGRALALDAVESMFRRLASASLGNPGALRGMPSGREAAAVLLILREFMHHLGPATRCASCRRNGCTA